MLIDLDRAKGSHLTSSGEDLALAMAGGTGHLFLLFKAVLYLTRGFAGGMS